MLNINTKFDIKPEQNDTHLFLEVSPGYACRGNVKVTGILNGTVVLDNDIDLAKVKNKYIAEIKELTSLKDSVLAFRGSLIPLPGKTSFGASIALSLDSGTVYSKFIEDQDFVIVLTPNIPLPPPVT